jgi:group I intron endonuclease
MDQYGYVYKTTNMQNNKIYIGMHKAQVFDKNYFGSGVLIKKAIKKYGQDNFIVELIEWCCDRENLCNKEKYWISYFGSNNPEIGYNLAQGGDGGDTFHLHTAEEQNEIRAKISERFKGRKQTDEWIEKRKCCGEENGMYGKHHTQETKEIISKKLSGENNPMYGVPSPSKGRQHSEETKEKIRKTKLGENNPNYGKVYTEQEIANLRELFSGCKNPRAMPCYLFCIETETMTSFNYIKEALDSVSILQSQYYYRKTKDGIVESPINKMHYKIILKQGGDNNG